MALTLDAIGSMFGWKIIWPAELASHYCCCVQPMTFVVVNFVVIHGQHCHLQIQDFIYLLIVD